MYWYRFRFSKPEALRLTEWLQAPYKSNLLELGAINTIECELSFDLLLISFGLVYQNFHVTK